MKIINELTDELIRISNDFNKGDTDKATVNLQIELMKATISNLDIRWKRPLDSIDDRTKQVFQQLLVRHQLKALSYLDKLIEADSKRQYNKLVRVLVSKKLFFTSFNTTMQRQINGYISRNQLNNVTSFNILILKQEKEVLKND
jgi:hypothetical protein